MARTDGGEIGANVYKFSDLFIVTVISAAEPGDLYNRHTSQVHERTEPKHFECLASKS